jgi:hypothetical protein
MGAVAIAISAGYAAVLDTISMQAKSAPPLASQGPGTQDRHLGFRWFRATPAAFLNCHAHMSCHVIVHSGLGTVHSLSRSRHGLTIPRILRLSFDGKSRKRRRALALVSRPKQNSSLTFLHLEISSRPSQLNPNSRRKPTRQAEQTSLSLDTSEYPPNWTRQW